MAGILRTAQCFQRYDKIAHELLSELLVAIATGGEVVGGNNRGSDVWSEKYGRIEVKSRILGTDGPYPRVSLRQSNLEKADHFVAVRWTKAFELHGAVMLPKSVVLKLYDAKLQKSGTAHIAWSEWIGQQESQDISGICHAALASGPPNFPLASHPQPPYTAPSSDSGFPDSLVCH